ncbi:MAG: hypothetical protein DRI93_02995 [Aquificota bacterium]|nr:MAG: hypothetical protein DRI93_02995 [Aquificota bacterium]
MSPSFFARVFSILVINVIFLSNPSILLAGFGFGLGKGGGFPLGKIVRRVKERSSWVDREYDFKKFKIPTADGQEQTLKLAVLYDNEGDKYFLAVNTLLTKGKGKCKPTFRQIYLEDPLGHRVYPVALIITERWAHVKVTITVTRYHYINGELVDTQTSVSSYEYDQFLGRKVGKILMEDEEKEPPPIYETLHEKPCGSVKGLISLFPIPPQYVSKIGESTLTVVLSAPPGQPVTTARFSLGTVEKAEEMVKVPVKMASAPTHAPADEKVAPEKAKKAETTETASPILTREREMVRKLEGEALVPMGEEDPCAECNRVARKLVEKQKELASRLSKLKEELDNTKRKEKELDEKTKAMKEEIEEDQKAVEAARENLAKIRREKQRFLEYLKDATNSLLGYDGVVLDDFHKDITGFLGAMGSGGGATRLLEPGLGVHFKNARAENVFFGLFLTKYRDRIDRLLQKEEEAQKQLEEAENRLAQAQNELAKNQKAKEDLLKAESELEGKIKTVGDAMAELNDLIDRVNKRCEMCEKIAKKIFAEKVPAERALEEAERRFRSVEPPDPHKYPEARSDYDAAEEVLKRAQELMKLKRFPRAREEANYVQELLNKAQAEKELTDRIEKMIQILTQGKRDFKKYLERNDCCPLHDVERTIEDFEKKIAKAGEYLRRHEPFAGLETLSHYPKNISGMIGPSARRCLEGKLADTVSRGQGMRLHRAESLLEDPEVKQTIKDIKDVFQEGADNLDKFGEYVEKLDEWRKKAEKAGLLKYADGKRTPTAILDALRQSLPKTKGHISAAKGRVEQAQKLVEELDKMVSQGSWEYFKDKASEELKERAIKLAADLAASGLGCEVAGPLAGIWGEAYGIGKAIGQRIVDLINEIQTHEFEKAKECLGLCDNRVNPEEVTIPHGIPVVYDVYIEIFDRCRTPLRAKADVTICRSPGCNYNSTISLVGIEKALGEVESSNMTHLPWRPGDVKVDVTCPNGKKPSEQEVFYHVQRYCEKDRVRVVIDIRVHTKGCRH